MDVCDGKSRRTKRFRIRRKLGQNWVRRTVTEMKWLAIFGFLVLSIKIPSKLGPWRIRNEDTTWNSIEELDNLFENLCEKVTLMFCTKNGYNKKNITICIKKCHKMIQKWIKIGSKTIKIQKHKNFGSKVAKKIHLYEPIGMFIFEPILLN